jgi:hypothetical protein
MYVPRKQVMDKLEQTAQPVEHELRQLYEQYLSSEEEEAKVTYFNAIAYDGQIACADAEYELPQGAYETRPTPGEPLPPTYIWYRQEYRVIVFKKHDDGWSVEDDYHTGCSVCNNGSTNLVGALSFCPIAEDPFSQPLFNCCTMYTTVSPTSE